MATYLFGLPSAGRIVLSKTAFPPYYHRQIGRFAATFDSIRPSLKTRNIFTRSASLWPNSYPPPRIFAQGALERRNRHTPLPFFELLTEFKEKPQERPLPRNRSLLRALFCGKGKLQQGKEGQVYLDIDKGLISALLPYLASEGVGASCLELLNVEGGIHMSAISPREAAFQDLSTIEEVGREYPFTIEGLYSLKNPASWPEVEEVWFLKVHCPLLEKLRRNYFLPRLPGGHSFMIALAAKPVLFKKEASLATHRISPSVRAA